MGYTQQQKDAFTKLSKTNDEWYTPIYAILPILEFIKPNSTILCPFDLDTSNFVKVFKKNGHNVINSHINEQDFLDIKKEDVSNVDYIISNPPFSKKTEILTKLFELEKPFAMLFPLVSTLETKKRFEIFSKNDIQLLLFDKRISFIDGGGYLNDKGKPSLPPTPPFPTIYLCWNLLDKQILWRTLDKTIISINNL